MSWADWNRSRGGGGLGSLFFLNEEGQLEASPDFWAYRVYLRDNKGRYWSPSKIVRGEGLNYGQESVGLNEWNKEHGVGQSIYDGGGNVFEGTRGMDDVYGEEAENIDFYEDDSGDYFISSLDGLDNDELLAAFEDRSGLLSGDEDKSESRDAYILDQLARDRAGRVIVTDAPYNGISIIGATHPRYNILGVNDIAARVISSIDPKVNQHNKGNAIGATALAHDAIRRLNAQGKKAWGGSESPIDHVLVESLKSGNGPLWMKALTDSDRERLGSARTWRELRDRLNEIDLENARQGIREYNDLSKRLRKEGRQPTKAQKAAFRKAQDTEYVIEELHPNDRISGAIITDAAPFGAAGIDFDNMMHDKVVEAIMRSLERFSAREGRLESRKSGWKSGPDDVRLVQVAVPLRTVFEGEEMDNLFNVDDIREGRVHGHRSDMNEYVAHAVKPFNDIGSAAEFLGNGADNPFRLYWLARLSGLPASEAWRKSLGDRFGDIETLISDEELKDTKRLAREACEPLLRQCMILNGLTRGPGNG